MIKSLRRKFIIITMCSIAAVFGILMVIINVANYYDVCKNADRRLDILEDNGGAFPRSDLFHEDGSPGDKKPHMQGLSPEAPFETRYFTVRLDNEGVVLSVDTGRIAAVDTEEAAQYASKLYTRGKMSGFYSNYKYRAISDNGGFMYIFLDCGKELSTFHSFLTASIMVSLLGILLIFLLVLLFSKIAIRPVAESYDKQRRFITDASHEIKTPLTIIDASAEVLEMEKGESEWIDSIRNQVARLSSLTEKLIFLSRMEEDKPLPNMTDFSLSDAVYEAAKSFVPIAASQNKTFHIDVDKNISFYGDESSMRQAVSLLLDNAMRYSDSRGTVEISLKRNGRGLRLIVRNTADNLQPGKLNVLFERFYRADASRNSEIGGSGIGLSVVKAIVAAHKGKITAESPDGRWANFTITF